LPILFIAAIALGLIFLLVSRSKREGKGSWVQFFSKGREAGFSFKEIEMLRHLAGQCNLEYPIALFTTQSQLDKCIYSLVRSIKMAGTSDDQGNQNFLSKLYDHRKKIELARAEIKLTLANSRQISEGQTLKILVTGTGVFKSQVVKNTNQYLTISRPINSKKSAISMRWQGVKISVYFSREDDAGYVFDSEVLDEVFSLGIPSLKISHGETLFRTQKRKSVRVKIHKAAFLYLVPLDEAPHKLEMDPGLKCFLEDISDTGCAVTVGGKADAGLRVKVQFALDNTAICMTGMVRSVDFDEGSNRSVLHVESEPLPVESRIHILGEVFNMLPEEDEEELPFRVEENEEGSSSQDSSASGELITGLEGVSSEEAAHEAAQDAAHQDAAQQTNDQ